jgi:hypothetical protein
MPGTRLPLTDYRDSLQKQAEEIFLEVGIIRRNGKAV